VAGQWLTAAAGIAGLKTAASVLARRILRRAMLMGVVGVLWCIAGGFAIAGITIWLSRLVGPIAACAIIAGVLAGGALAIQFGMSAASHPTQVAAAPPEPAVDEPDRGKGFEDAPVSDEAVLGTAAAVTFVGYLLGRLVRKT
jgi:hypothetical protein